jgi:CubicO group peptidase (beta-lactamase class C family)
VIQAGFEPAPLPSRRMDVLPGTARRLLARVAAAQAEARLPSLVAGIVRDGGLAWHGARGRVGGAPPGPDTQYRIGSISKTFTALLVMRLRDEGALALTDRFEEHVPGSPFGDRTVGQLLAHGGGVQAETSGEWWERTPVGSWDEVVAQLDEHATPHAPGRRFHYSNLGFGALGELVARKRGMPWFEALRAEILEPLGLRRTSYRPVAPHATGYAVHPWAQLLLEEPEHDAGALAPAGQLWSTLADLGRFGAFLLGDTGDVLSRDTLEEMRAPALVDETGGGLGNSYGLGLQVTSIDDRRLTGHNGAMPGFVASVFVDAEAKLGAVWAANITYGGDRELLGALLRIVREAEPPIPGEWAPAPLPEGIGLDLLGTWNWGPNSFVLQARGDGLIELVVPGRKGRESRFRRDGDDWVGLDGYFEGERLRIDPDGRHLWLATFVLTREPYGDGPVPGGVDPGGWTA